MKNGAQEAVVSLNAKILKEVVVRVDVVDHKGPIKPENETYVQLFDNITYDVACKH